MKRIRVTAEHRRDFAAYLRWRRTSRGFLPWRSSPFERGGCNTVEAFVSLESQGICERPRQPRVLAAVLEGKKLLNFQIKQWAEGTCDLLLALRPDAALADEREFRAAWPWLPEWAWLAVRKQAGALARAAAESMRDARAGAAG